MLLFLSIYRLDTDKYFIDKLTVDHVDFIADYWTDSNKDLTTVTKYLSHVITMYYSTAIFLTSTPSTPISWSIYGDFGHIIHLYTLPEYRKSNLSLITSVDLDRKLKNIGLIGVGERHKDGLRGKRLHTLGEFFPDYTWRDSITGECYW